MVTPLDKPLAAPGLKSYRYKYGPGGCHYVMIGARNDADALNEARRSVNNPQHVLSAANLQAWDGTRYVQVKL